MKKVLLTGINGLVGTAIAERLSGRYDIYGIGRRNECQSPCAEYLQGDIGDKETISRVKNEWGHISFDTVIHCAAEISEDAFQLYQTNCYGTQNMADFAIETGCTSFIYMSSIPIIGQPKELPITEEHEINPPSVYHRTKYLGEIITRQTLEGKCDYKILRFASPLGPTVSEKRIASIFLKNCIDERDLNIFGSGNRIQNYIDVRDLAYAVDCALSAKGHSGMYLISGRSVADKELAEICRRVCGSKNQIIIGEPDKKEEQWEIDGRKALLELGYESKLSLEQTLAWLVESWKQ